jgi:hypothetical protein
MDFHSRELLPFFLNELGFKDSGIELGVANGKHLGWLVANSNIKYWYGIDRWNDHHDITEYAGVVEQFRHASDVTILRATFHDALILFEDNSFDFIYIDGYAHLGQEHGRTLDEWWPKLKTGGLFAGHDYHRHWPLTVQAVNAFVKKHQLEMSTTQGDMYPTWMVRKP